MRATLLTALTLLLSCTLALPGMGNSYDKNGPLPYRVYVSDKYVEENRFLKTPQNTAKPPGFDEVRDKLPSPHWPARPDAIECYWKAWEIGFRNLHAVTKENNFVSPYIDAAFNGNIFIWDTCFMTMFGKYGSNAFNFQGSLDNFYRKQAPDGFICREIRGSDGTDCFERYEPASTGPNIMPWAEWEYYLNFNDKERLAKIFAPLLAYYNWLHVNRTWKDGSYYLSGWGCGMDNQPRLEEGKGYSAELSHGHMSWIDANLQQIMAGKLLIKMAGELKREKDVEAIRQEVDSLTDFVNTKMWNRNNNFYGDLFRDGGVSDVQSIGAYWALLADIVPQENLKAFLAHLDDPKKFNRPHRVTTLSADDPHYMKTGGYWRGAVWAPTTYMVLRGLTEVGEDKLAYEIALNHFDNVVKVFKDTGTFFENYVPEEAKGSSRKDFVGWTGLPPITVMFEYIFGIRADVPHNKLVWDIRLTDEFGVSNYPLGNKGLLDLKCEKRNQLTDEPKVSISSTVDLNVTMIWEGGRKEIIVKGIR